MAGPARPILALASLFFVAAGVVLQIFTVLTGGVNDTPLNHFYFLEASTSGIPDTRNPSRWTFFAVCGVDGSTGLNDNCDTPKPANPFDPPRNFATTTNVPEAFIGAKQYFLLSRFMFAFYLIALFFAAIALLTGILALISRLGGYISSLTTSVALFFQVLAATLMTVWVVKGRNVFRAAGFEAHIGRYLMAFAWASVACFFLATISFLLGGRLGGSSSSKHYRNSHVSRTRSTRSNRSRGSFLDTGSQRKTREYSP